MTKIEDQKDIQDIKLNNLEVQLQKIAKLNYNNPWLDQSNQNIPIQDKDYKTSPLLNSYQKDYLNLIKNIIISTSSKKI